MPATAPPAANFAAAAAARPTVTPCAPAVPEITGVRAANKHWRQHSCRDNSSGVRDAPWDAARAEHGRAGEGGARRKGVRSPFAAAERDGCENFDDPSFDELAQVLLLVAAACARVRTQVGSAADLKPIARA